MPEFRDSSDFLNTSTSLRRANPNREFFNPENGLHVDSLKHFLRTGNWGQFQFYCEAPYTDVPMTVLMLFAQHELNVTRETPAETAARLKQLNIKSLAALAEEKAALDRVEEQALVKG